MRDRPEAEALLWQARKTLLEDLMPALPEARRYEALMVASAMAMAAREAAAMRDEADERARLAALLDEPVAPEQAGKALAAAIRAGKRDGDGAVYDALLGDATARLAISNPKLLPKAEP